MAFHFLMFYLFFLSFPPISPVLNIKTVILAAKSGKSICNNSFRINRLKP